MNEHEMDRIADAMHRLRPDWPVKSIRALLAKPELASRARRDVTVALAWVACESDSHTPARVLENGPWWRAAGVEGSVTKRHPRPEDACRTCGAAWSPTCCDNPTHRPAPAADHTAHAAAARALLHGRTA
jgi:hypothetical protein